MMRDVGSYEAKTRFAEILRAVEEGQSFFVTRNGERVAQIVPCPSRRKRKRGCLRSRLGKPSADFGAPVLDFAEYQ
jgi:prevent-host-death family protein